MTLPAASRHARPFVITIQVEITEQGVWLIHARVRFREGVPPRKSPRLRQARQALWREIEREKARGKKLGVTRIRVHVKASDFTG